MKKLLLLGLMLLSMGGVISAKEVKTPILLTGGLNGCNPTPSCFFIEMQGWQSFIAYENAEGIAFDANSTMVFNMDETTPNGAIRVTFTFKDESTGDESTLQRWWCLGIGNSADDTSTLWGHELDNSTYWLKKGLGDDFDSKKDLKITKVTVDNFGTEDLFTYKVIGGTICGQPMTIKNANAKTFGYYGGVFSPTAAQQNIFKMKPFAVGNNQKIVIKFGEATPEGWAIVTSASYPPSLPTGITEYEISLDGTDLSEFSIFNWDANPTPINISEIYFVRDEIEARTATTLNSSLFCTWTGPEKDATKTGAGDLENHIGEENMPEGTTFWGHGGVLQNQYADLSTYESMTIYASVGGRIRAIFNSVGATNPKTYVEDIRTVGAEGFITYDFVNDDQLKNLEFVHLNCIKSPWGASACTISDIRLKGKERNIYELSGATTGAASLTSALSDNEAVVYDGIDLTNTAAIALTPTNTNALFVVTDAAKLSNTSNVVVKNGLSYSSTKIELVDGKPFYAPFNITSTASSYSRTTSAGEWATAVLPFDLDVTKNDDATYYTFTSATTTSASFEEVTTGTIAANTPFLYQATGTSVEFVGGNISATIDGYNIQAIGETGWYIAQSMESKVIDDVTTDPFFKDYDVYGIAGDDLVHATKKLTTKPFRAFYLKPKSVSAGSRLLITTDDSEATAINEVDADADKVTTGAIYNMAGQQVDANYKGVVIDENGRKYLQK